MGKGYIQDEPESQKEHKTAEQVLEEQDISEHITDSMRGSSQMYADADDDETPAIERHVSTGQVGSGTMAKHLTFETDPELEAQVAAERKANEKKSKERAEAKKLEHRAAKSATRNSDIHQTSFADEKLYPEAKPEFDPEDEKYWRQQMSKKNPLPKQTRIETVEDSVLDDSIKQSAIAQGASFCTLIVGIILSFTDLPGIFSKLSYLAAIVAMSIAIFMLHKATIGRKLTSIQQNQRDKFYLATILPGIFLRYAALIIVGLIPILDQFGIFVMIIQFLTMSIVASKYYDFLARYGIEYDIKMTIYTTILTAPALIANIGIVPDSPMILISVYIMLFQIAMLIFVPDMLAGKAAKSRFKTH